jgi:hypothetical protein
MRRISHRPSSTVRFQLFYSEVDRQLQTTGEAEKQAEVATDEKLRQEWGADYTLNKNMAEALLARAPQGFRDKFMNGYLNDRTPIKASVEAWKWLVQMEREINPAATVLPGQSGDLGKSIEAELKSLREMQKTNPKEYWKDESNPRARATRSEGEVGEESSRCVTSQQRLIASRPRAGSFFQILCTFQIGGSIDLSEGQTLKRKGHRS